MAVSVDAALVEVCQGAPVASFFATCARGLEALTASELAEFGATAIAPTRAGVAFEGSLEVGYRACLWSRVASRILLGLGDFPAPDQDALYAGIHAIDWREHLRADSTLAVSFTEIESCITNTHFGALKTKDAIVDRMREETGERPSVDLEDPSLRVHVHLDNQTAKVSIDLSGGSLHLRGYRRPGAPAPLKENLAAAILLLADWPSRAKKGAPLFDPMCGSGTFLVEAAMIAADRAPGLGRKRFGFERLPSFDEKLWSGLIEEARAREDQTKIPPLFGSDIDPQAVRATEVNLDRAFLRKYVQLETRNFVDILPPPGPPGMLVMNPPYGERLGEEADLGQLYTDIGDVLRRRFLGWTAFVLSGNLSLIKQIGLKSSRRETVYNGAIECRLLELPIASAPVTSDLPAYRRPMPIDPGVDMFVNRLQKNLKHVRKWAAREKISCYRVYDRDLPDYAVAIDVYETAVNVQEYAYPKTVDQRKAEGRMRDLTARLPDVLGVDPESIFVKFRRRQRESDGQYEKQDNVRDTRWVTEGGHQFLVNLSDYVDTGLFLDHRRLRGLIGELSRGRKFLNLFSYTGAATIYAAAGGASSTVSIDLSNTYLDWAVLNFERNKLSKEKHELVRADVLKWLPESEEKFDLIFLAPPTFSNSKKMEDTLDVQRDHTQLITQSAALLSPGGILLFSNHFRRFKMDAPQGLTVESITDKTLPYDFRRSPRIHNAWKIQKA